MIVVADSSPLQYLILLDETPLLHRFYGDVLPEAVVIELRAARAPQRVREWISRLSSVWLEDAVPVTRMRTAPRADAAHAGRAADRPASDS